MQPGAEPFPVFDGHNDTLLNLYGPDREDGRSFFRQSQRGHIDLPRARKGGLIGGIFAIFPPTPRWSKESDPTYGFRLTDDGYEQSLRSPVSHAYASDFSVSLIDRLHQLVKDSHGQADLVRSAWQLQHNLDHGVLSVVLHLEGADAIDPDLSDLDAYYARGVRSLGLVWSRPNAFGCGVPFRFPHTPDTGPGLTEAGRRLVQACNRMGIMIDLAHINEQGFWDVAAETEAPLVVSHAGVHAICPSTRNLTDAQIDAVGRSHGVIGIIFEPVNTRPDGRMEPETPLSVIIRHIDHVVDRIGVDHVAFGSDFDGADVPVALGDVAGLPVLIQALRDHGYEGQALEKIAYRNWFRVLEDSWTV